MGQSFYLKNSTENYPKSTSIRNFEAIKPNLLPQSLDIQNSFFWFFNVYVFVNNKWTLIARKLIFFRKYRYFNSLSNATHPIQISRLYLKKNRKTILRKSRIGNKTKTHRPNLKMDFSPARINKENVTCPVKIDRVEAEI